MPFVNAVKTAFRRRTALRKSIWKNADLEVKAEWDQAKPAGPVGICAIGVQGGAYK